jgi:hypothetical protein
VHGAVPNLAHGVAAMPAMGMGAAHQDLIQPTATAATSTTTTTTSDAHRKATAPPSNNILLVPSEVPKSSGHGTKKPKGKPFCYRCHTKGHTITVCTAVLSCDICYGDHVTKVCPNAKNMQVSVIPCGYAVEGLGFYFIPVAENPKIQTNDKSAMVRVLEGSLTAEQLAVELDKLLPGKNKWV